MSRIPSKPVAKPLERTEAVALLRTELLKVASEGQSICQVAAERGIFCQGFRQYSDGGLRRRYSWIDKRRPGASREELEGLANEWQLARQEVDQLPTACDVQQKEHDSCRGWDDFSNEELSRFCFELIGRAIVVV